MTTPTPLSALVDEAQQELLKHMREQIINPSEANQKQVVSARIHYLELKKQRDDLVQKLVEVMNLKP